MYTINDARREMNELFDEGWGFGAVRVFLNDLSRSGDITWDENKQLCREIIERTGGKGCSIPTF